MPHQTFAKFDSSFAEHEPLYSTAELQEMKAKEDPLYFFKEVHPAVYIGGTLLIVIVVTALILAFKKPKLKKK